MSSPKEKKTFLRKKTREILRAKPNEELCRESRCICEKLTEYLERENLSESKIAVFSPLPYEPDLSELHRLLPTAEIYYPLCGEGNSLTFHRIDFPDIELTPGMMGIREPVVQDSPVRPEDLDVILVPGMAFTRDGGRLGKGGGYYDRFFSGNPVKALRIGVAFACQIVDDIPHEEHDFRVNTFISS